MWKFLNFAIFLSLISAWGANNIFASGDNVCDSAVLDEKDESVHCQKLTRFNQGAEDLVDIISPECLAKDTKEQENFKDKAKILLPCLLLGGASIAQAMYNNFDYGPLFVAKGSAVLFAGIECGDLLSGINHAALDFTDYRNKKLSTFLRQGAYSFQAHHYDTKQITKVSYWLLTRFNYQLIMLPLALTAVAAYNGYDGCAAVASVSLLTFAQAQLVHSCAHGKKVIYPLVQKAIEWLQSHDVLLNLRYHAGHHSDPEHGKGFCGVTGHMDCVVDPVVSYGRRLVSKFSKFLYPTSA